MTPLFIPSYKNEDFFLCHLFPTPCYLSLVICYFARSALKRIAKLGMNSTWSFGGQNGDKRLQKSAL